MAFNGLLHFLPLAFAHNHLLCWGLVSQPIFPQVFSIASEPGWAGILKWILSTSLCFP
jgi:hypothetical protein